MKNMIATLFLVLLAGGCYSSSRATGDAGADPTIDTTQDPQVDPVIDPVVDALPDLVDVPVDTPLEPDVPPPPPYSVTFVIENQSPPTCSSCIYYLEYMDYSSTMYGLGITWNGESILWESPYCMMDCEDVTDPAFCCLPCPAPMPAVQQIVPGRSVTVTWYGEIYTIDNERCDCGCYWHSPAAAGSGMVQVCAYRSYTCIDSSTCVMDDNGFIQMAEGAGDTVCAEASFSFPAYDGREVVLGLTP